MAVVWPSAYSVALRLQRVPRALQGRVRVSRALHGREGRLTRLAPAPRALGGRAMSDDEQTQLETHAPMEGGAQLSHGPGTAAETGAAALAGAAEAVTDPPATLRARMIVDLAANFVPTSTNVAAVADTLLDQDFESMHDVMEVDLTASDLLDMFPFDPDLVVALRVGLAVAVVVRGVTLLGTASYTPPTAAAAVASACRDLARARLLPVFAQPAPLPIMLPVAAVEVQPMTPTTIVMAQAVDP